MLITRPEFPGEPDFLSDARGPAIFLSLDGVVIRSHGDACSSWTHGALEALLDLFILDGLSVHGWDCYVGGVWCGGSEV